VSLAYPLPVLMATPQLAMRAKPSATNNVSIPSSLATNSSTNNADYACAIDDPQAPNLVGAGPSKQAAISDAGCTAGNCTGQTLCILGGCAALAINRTSAVTGFGVSPGLGQQPLQGAIQHALDDCSSQGIECTYVAGICSDYCTWLFQYCHLISQLPCVCDLR
jgi:hypothetical protein